MPGAASACAACGSRRAAPPWSSSGLGDRLLFVAPGGAARFFGRLQRLRGLGFVQIVAADRGVGEDRDHVRLHLEDAAGDEDQLLLAAARGLDAHRARLDAGDERRVARIDAELARFAGQHDELRLAGEDRLLGADDVDVDGVCHRVCFVCAASAPYCIVFGLLERFLDRARPCRTPARAARRIRR